MDRNVLANYLAPILRPYDAGTMAAQDVGLGGASTEYLETTQDAGGEWVNYPRIWWDSQGRPHLLSPQNALAVTADWETQGRGYAPRYNNLGAAVWGAMNRSENGGGDVGPLFGAER